MRFRKWLFSVLALLALAWIVYGFSVSSGAAASGYSNNSAQYAATTEATSRTAANVGTTVGAGIAYTIFLCTGGPLFLIFALLAWRNAVGERNARQHKETLAAIRGAPGP